MKKVLYFKRLRHSQTGEEKAAPCYGYRIKGVMRCFFVEKIGDNLWGITERDTGLFCDSVCTFREARRWVGLHENQVDKIITSDKKEYQNFYEKSLKAYKELSENDTEKDC